MAQRYDNKELIEPIIINVGEPNAVHRWNSKSLLKVVFGLLALALILLLWFIVTAKTLIVEITPAPDQLNLSEGSFALKLQQRYLAQPGDYRLMANKQGYYPLNEIINIGVLPAYTFKRTLQKKPGLVSIDIEQGQHARVYIDSRYVGIAPMRDIALTPGTHSIELQRYRYQTLWSELQVEGAGSKQNFSFSLTPDWSVVRIDSKPSNAQIWLNGMRYENTPASLQLDAGTHHLEIVHADYSAHISDFVVLPNQPLDLGVIDLDRDPSYLIIKSNPVEAKVYANNKLQGTTPLTINAVPNIDYQLSFDKSGYRGLSRTVKVATGESKTVSVALKPILSSVHLDITPDSAQVFIDGVLQGRGSQTLSLTTTNHKIEIKESGYDTHVFNIMPQVGQPLFKKITLKLRQNPSAELAQQITNGQGQQFKLIEPGEFVMGSSRREQGRRANEVLRKIKLTRKFYVAINEVTNEEYSRFDPQHDSGNFGGVKLSDAKLPVTNITWQQAVQYCNWLSRKEDLPLSYQEKDGKLHANKPLLTGYRLLTEAEWAWLARVKNDGSLLRYAWGDEYPPNALNGNYADQSTSQIIGLVIANKDDGYAGPAPVGSFSANHYGVNDIDANVAEWVHDYYTIYSNASTQVSVDPSGPKQGKHHVIRGASWLRGTLSNTRLAYRDYREKPQVDVGFRIARYVER